MAKETEQPFRIHKQLLWRNNTLYYPKKVTYNFNARKVKNTINDSDSPGAFGQVVIAYNRSLPLNNRTLKLTDQVNIAPADYLCVHTPYPSDRGPATFILATTMFFGKQSFLLNNTINNWSNLRPFVQPVLYVSPSSEQYHAHATVMHACSMGWDVYVVPECNAHGFPVLRSMMADLIHKYSAAPVLYLKAVFISSR